MRDVRSLSDGQGCATGMVRRGEANFDDLVRPQLCDVGTGKSLPENFRREGQRDQCQQTGPQLP
jgi:hypothetical protein